MSMPLRLQLRTSDPGNVVAPYIKNYECYRLLTSLCSRLDIWQTTYVHPLDGADGIVEWFEGSGLRPFLEPLTSCEREAFLSRYRSELAAAYPTQPNGKVLLRYPRLFFVAQR